MTTPAFRFDDQRHERIHRRLLRLVSPGSASFFRDACRLVAEPDAFDSMTHLVGHLLRETESSIRYAFQPIIKDSGARPATSDERHRFEIEQALSALSIAPDDPAAHAWLALGGKGNVKGLHALAHRQDLGPPRPFDGTVREAFELVVTALDAVLEKVEERWEVILTAFDKLAAKHVPTTADAEELRLRLPNSLQVRAHFFGQLRTPAWIRPLADQGFFRQPPAPVRDEEAGTIGFPPWPESQYLIRMAQEGTRALQGEIITIAEGFPASDNVRVYEDLASLALTVEPVLSARLLPQIRSALQLPYLSRLPSQSADFVLRLISGNLRQAALELARDLLSLRPDPRTERYEDSENPFSSPQPRPGMPDARYDDILEKVVSPLSASAPKETFDLMCDLLEGALRLSQKTSRQEGPEAHSQVWWPDLAEAGPQHAEPTWLLLGALRRLVLGAAQQGPAPALEFVEKLEHRPWHAFRRLALFLLRLASDIPIEAIESRLLRLGDHEELELHAEYESLLRDRYRSLSAEGQSRIADHLSREWEVSAASENFQFWHGREPTAEELQLRRDRWLASRLKPIADHLPPALRAVYDRAAQASQSTVEAQPPEAGWLSERSPKSSEELGGMTDAELVEYLSHIELGDELTGPSREGLGDALAAATTSNPQRFAVLASHLKSVDPAYQYGLFSGLRIAVAAHALFPWEPVLDLANAAAALPRVLPDESQRNRHRPDEGWVRRAIADLLLEGFKEGAGEIPFPLREAAWAALQPITNDPDPDIAKDAEQKDEEERARLYLSSVRGRAFDAVWGYIVWVYRHLHAPRTEPMTFQPIAEVREALERHVDPAIDPSPAIRVFYGTKLSQLRRLDIDWVRAQLPRFFPDGEGHAQLRASTWRAYLRFTEVVPPDLELLGPYYAQAIETLGTPGGDDDKSGEHLGVHLVRLQWLGALSVNEPDGMIARFFDRADADLRGKTLATVGRILLNTKDQVPTEVLSRMRDLWIWRRTVAQRAPDPRTFAEELSAFGWWFASAHFDSGWALEELHASLRLSPQTQMSTLVIKKLEELSPEYPRLCIDCLARIVEGGDPHFGADFLLEHVRPILEQARHSPDTETQAAAIELVNRLSSLGHTQFRDLIE